MADIVTDVSVLRRISEKADDNEIDSIISQLEESIPENTLGLAAIQINIPRRIFIANLTSGSHVFVNPKITWTSIKRVPSVEACLSIPGCTRCIERHSEIDVTSEYGVLSWHLVDQDAFIVQHEYDHINGVLITDYAEIKTSEQKKAERDKSRTERITKSRALKHNKKEIKPKSVSKKISAKKKGKLQRQAKKKKRVARTVRRQEKIRVEIEERYKADQKNLFKDESNTV